MPNTLIIRGARRVDPLTGRDEVADLLIDDGRIVSSLPRHATPLVLPAEGLVLAPGFLDLHVHTRDPGQPEAETLESASRAAAAGGFTAIVTMPNTDPPMDTPEAIRRQLEQAARVSRIRILPAGCLTRQRAGREPVDLFAMIRAGVYAFTDDGTTPRDETVMETVMQTAASLGIPVLDHPQDPQLAASGVIRSGAVAVRLGLLGIPPEAEVRIVERDIRLAARTECRTHLQHLSCRQSVALLRKARASGIPISAEATPHHLALTVDDIPDGNNGNFKMNPPLGDRDDQEALMAAVAEGVIQALATDHAPHPPATKSLGLPAAPFGVIGLETAVGVTYTLLVKSGRMSLVSWVQRWTTGPAAILGLPPPSLEAGTPADFVLLDLQTEWTVTLDAFHSPSRNSPFLGRRLIGRAVATFLGGEPVWMSRQGRWNRQWPFRGGCVSTSCF